MPGNNVFQMTWEHLGCLEPAALQSVRSAVLTALSLNHRCLRAMQLALQHVGVVGVRSSRPSLLLLGLPLASAVLQEQRAMKPCYAPCQVARMGASKPACLACLSYCGPLFSAL